ncbi:hypothetical protein D3C86_2239890 [compost metagenome]
MADIAPRIAHHVELQVGYYIVIGFTYRATPQQSAQTQHQFRKGEGLNQVIIGTQFEAMNAILHPISCGQK